MVILTLRELVTPLHLFIQQGHRLLAPKVRSHMQLPLLPKVAQTLQCFLLHMALMLPPEVGTLQRKR